MVDLNRPTAEQIPLVIVQLRWTIAQSALGVDLVSQQIWRLLIVEGDGWTEKGMAEYLHISRSTLRRSMQSMLKNGSVERVSGGIVLTDQGAARGMQLWQECMDIARGARASFSPAFIEASRAPGMNHSPGDDIEELELFAGKALKISIE